MFAVIRTGGKQYRVAADQVIKVDKVTGEPGDIVAFPEVLMLGGDAPKLGSPTVAGATVAAELLEQGRDRKVIAFKKRRRKNSRRKRGHRQEFSLLRITEILTEGRQPTMTARPKAAPARPAKADDDEADAGAKAEAQPATEPKAKAKAAAKPKTSAKPAAKAKAAEKPKADKAKAGAKKTAAKKPAAKGKK